jgi:Kdo2-lipid IVA lauroyltransferase/acyltransferase
VTAYVDLAARSVLRALRLTRDLILAVLVLTVALPVWVLPWRTSVMLGRLYGYVSFFFWPAARRAGMINFRRAYGPSVTTRQAWWTILAVFGNMGRSIAEGVQFSRRFGNGQPGWEALYEPEDAELETKIRSDPRPKIFASGHLGSWEIAVAAAGLRVGQRGAAIIRRVDNPFLNAVVYKLRVNSRSQWIEKRGAAAEALRRIRGGDSIALFVDENAGARGTFVEFFGRPASTNKTAAILSLMTGAPIVLGAAVRQPGRQKLLYRLAVIEPRDVPNAGPAAVGTLTQEVLRIYERWIAEAPLQWRWIHWRWKTRPDGVEEAYRRRDLKACFAAGAATAGSANRIGPQTT